MSLDSDLLDELSLLARFPLDTADQGLKLHHDAEPALRAAAGRLFDKGMITHRDGGYLTDRGREAAEQWMSVYRLLTAPSFQAPLPVL